MIYGSVCSGIEAATVAWHPLGWKPAFFAEIEKHPCSVLKHHYPDVPNLGDMTKFKEWPDYAIDLLIGGTPCQSFSVAGLRKGLADPRGNLALTYLAIADRYRPEWCVWENVPGVLSSGEGRDFGSFLGGLAELGYGFAYRVLDAQFIRVESHPFAVPQRRRRVIVVAHLGDWRRAAAVLFERESLSGHSPPRREAGKGASTDVVPSLISSGQGVERAGETRGQDPVIAEFVPDIVSQAMSSKWSKGSSGPAGDEVANLVAHTLRAEHDATEDGTGRGTPLVVAFDAKGSQVQTDETGAALTLRSMNSVDSHDSGGGHMAVAFQDRARGDDGRGYDRAPPVSEEVIGTLETVKPWNVAFDLRGREGGAQFEGPHDTANIRAASGGSSRSYVAEMAVRRLTPVECCRLQGFPDDYLDCLKSDGPKYKALGNSMATNVIRWLGDRIEMVSKL